MTLFSIVLFIALQIIWLPLSLVGGVWVGYRQIRTSQKQGLSGTAIEVINGRWTMDVFGIRNDPAARRLMRALPNTSVMGLWLALFPLFVLYRLSKKNLFYPRIPESGKESIADLIVARTLYFDQLIEKHSGSAAQFVLMGAGLDTRAYNRWEDQDLKFFELDQQATQNMKIRSLRRARVPSSHVEYVEVDFSHENWIEGLVEVGFDSSLKTIFLWEGVTLYLSEEEVCETLVAVKAVAGNGSVLLTDFYAERFVKMAKKGAMARTLEATNETLGFGIDFSRSHESRLRDFINTQGVQTGEERFLGAESKKGPFAEVTEIKL